MGRFLYALIFAAWSIGAAAETPVVRVAVLKFGTVNWLMDTIQANGLDRDQGYTLQIVPLAGKAATSIAFQSGDVDLIVTDWVWAMRQRGQGADYRFFPYSRALGAVMSRGDTGIQKICDLKGRPIGVVGGPLDKSWLILQALVARDCGFALNEETQTLYGAPPLMSRQLETGGIDAVVTYWHYAARLSTGDATEVLEISDALDQLGISPAPALVGFVWDRTRSDPDAIKRFQASAQVASGLLGSDDAQWNLLKPGMRAGSDAEFTALRDRFRNGIASDWTDADTEAARRTHEILTEAGGAAFIATAGAFDPRVFDGPDD